MAEEQRNFRGALAQRRHINGENVEAVIEVLTESAGFHGFLHVHVGGGENAHVDIHQVAAAEAGVLVILQDVEQLGLQVRGHLRDFIKEDRAFVGQLELAGLRADRAGECALLVSEELGFEQLTG